MNVNILHPVQKAVTEAWEKWEREGKTKRELAKFLGISSAYLTEILKGRKKGERKAKDFAEKLDRPLAEFFYQNVENAPVPKHKPHPIPIISWIHAGEFDEASDPWPKGYSGEGEAVFSDAKAGENVFALKIQGRSMEPRYMEGDIIIVDPDLGCENGDHCVVKYGEEVTFKIYKENDLEIRLVPMNETYPDIVVPKNRAVEFKVVGRVVDMKPKLK